MLEAILKNNEGDRSATLRRSPSKSTLSSLDDDHEFMLDAYKSRLVALQQKQEGEAEFYKTKAGEKLTSYASRMGLADTRIDVVEAGCVFDIVGLAVHPSFPLSSL